MEVKDLKLDEISFKEAPTKSQIVNTLADIEKFLNKMGGSLLMEGTYCMGDPAVGALLNGIMHIRSAKDAFENGPNATGLALPQPQPMPMPRR